MSIWKRYGWTDVEDHAPLWWKVHRQQEGGGSYDNPTPGVITWRRSDGKLLKAVDSRLSNSGAGFVIIPREHHWEQLREFDLKNPMPCPPVAVGQVWYFPKADIDVLVVFRDGEAYLTTGPDMSITDRMTEEDLNTNTADEYNAVPPYMGETGWLVAGPGAPWAPMGEE